MAVRIWRDDNRYRIQGRGLDMSKAESQLGIHLYALGVTDTAGAVGVYAEPVEGGNFPQFITQTRYPFANEPVCWPQVGDWAEICWEPGYEHDPRSAHPLPPGTCVEVIRVVRDRSTAEWHHWARVRCLHTRQEASLYLTEIRRIQVREVPREQIRLGDVVTFRYTDPDFVPDRQMLQHGERVEVTRLPRLGGYTYLVQGRDGSTYAARRQNLIPLEEG